MGRRFKSCLGAAEKRFLVAQREEQSAAQAASVAANSPTIDFQNIKEGGHNGTTEHVENSISVGDSHAQRRSCEKDFTRATPAAFAARRLALGGPVSCERCV